MTIAATSHPPSVEAMHGQGTRKRAEIEGLRTVAALLVASYHIWMGRVSGGVDVFFVVTGFLITLTLVGQVRRNGSIHVRSYLGRIFRRIWPMAAITLSFILVMTVSIAPPALRERNFTEAVSSALFLENWFLAVNSVDYLNAEDPATPAQHFWAMSVQGQFYLIWLGVAAFALVLFRRTALSYRKTLMVVLIVLFAISFVWSILHTRSAQSVAYFDTTARLWEFAVGGIVALLGARVLLSGLGAALASWIGLIGLVSCGFVFPVAASFPGYVALWPVLSAALLLASTREDERWWSATRLLATPVLVWAGGFAFGIYLWHWPLLIGYRYIAGLHAQPDFATGAAILGASVLLAWLCHLGVERPLVRAPRGSRRIVAFLVATWLGVTGVGLFAIAQSHSVLSATPAPSEAQSCFGADAILDIEGCGGIGGDETEDLVPEASTLLRDTGGAYACYTMADAQELEVCSAGSGDLRVALIGNSHAAMFAPEFMRRADDLGWSIDVMVGNGCVWSVQRVEELGEDELCHQRLSEQEGRLFGELPYDLVIFAGGRGSSSVDDEVVQRIAQNWRSLAYTGAQIVVLEDNPRLTEEEAACVLMASSQQLREGLCDAPLDSATEIRDRYVDAAELVGGTVVPTQDLYCVDDTCPIVIGDVIVYRDEHHVTATYTNTTIDEIGARLRSEHGAR